MSGAQASNMADFLGCMFAEATDYKCGISHFSKTETCLVLLSECNKSTVSHLRSLHLSGSEVTTEKELIENRSGETEPKKDAKICPKHRYVYGICYRPRKTCEHPHPIHKGGGQGKGKLKVAVRGANDILAPWISQKYDMKFPIGGSLCTACRNAEEKSMKAASSTEDEDIPSTSIEMHHTNNNDGESQQPVDPDFSFPFVQTPVKSKNQTLLAQFDDESPLKFSVVESSVKELAPSTVRYMKRKYKQLQSSFKGKLLESMAPGQGQDLKDLLSTSDEDTDHDHTDSYLENMKEEFLKLPTNKMKIQLLSLIPPDKYTNLDLTEVFHCSIYLVKQARNVRKQYGPLNDGGVKHIIRSRVDDTQIEHFLDWLFSSGALQDTAYGTSTITCDGGETFTVPRAILVSTREHTVQCYLQFCMVTGYESHLSRSLLVSIIEDIKPSQQKAMAGLDNYTADGISGFDKITQSVVPQLELSTPEEKRLLAQVDMAKKFLKISYKNHCVDTDSSCYTHCPIYALSVGGDNTFSSLPCDHEHHLNCADCINVFSTLELLQNLVDQKPETPRNAEIKYDLEQATNCILTWMIHIMRGCQQDRAKSFVINELLNDHTSMWLKDWSQKILPRAFREKQEDYFGKRGMSLHVDVFFTRPANSDPNELYKSVYFTLLDRCEQDMKSTLVVADHVLKKFHVDHPNVIDIHCKSDNAGCYAGASCYEGEYKVCKTNDLHLVRHDFNEPQQGKDQADRESAKAKGIINAYLNQGHDVVSAANIFNALSNSTGETNYSVSVIDINAKATVLSRAKIPEIQSFHTVLFQEHGMQVFKYFEIGQGRFIPYQDIQFVPQYEIEKPWNAPAESLLQSSQKLRADRMLRHIWFCHDENCMETFLSENALETHTQTGKHMYEKEEKLSTKDKARKGYVKRMKVTNTPPTPIQWTENTANVDYSGVIADSFKKPGYAIKQRRPQTRLGVNQKSFLTKLYLEGETSGKKVTVDKVVSMIRNATNMDGSKMFTPAEYLTKNQVLSQFATMTQKKKKGTLYDPAIPITDRDAYNSEDEELDIVVQEMVEYDDRAAANDVVQQVLRDTVVSTDAEPGLEEDLPDNRGLPDQDIAVITDDAPSSIGISGTGDALATRGQTHTDPSLAGEATTSSAGLHPRTDSYLAGEATTSSAGLHPRTDSYLAGEATTSSAGLHPRTDSYYAVDYVIGRRHTFYIGRVMGPGSEPGYLNMKFLQRVGSCGFRWPNKIDIEDVHTDYIFHGPITLTGHGPFSIDEAIIKQIMKKLPKK